MLKFFNIGAIAEQAEKNAEAVAHAYEYCIVRKNHEKTKHPQNLMRGALEAEMPGARIWTDNEVLSTPEEAIRNSRNIVLFLTSEFTTNEEVLTQLLLAKELGKHVIPIRETLSLYHGVETKQSWEKLMKDCPKELKGMFGSFDTCLEWRGGQPRVGAKEIIMASEAEGNHGEVNRTALGGFTYVCGVGHEEIPVLSRSLLNFAAFNGVPLPGAGRTTLRWTIVVRSTLTVCAFLCMSRLFTTEGPAFFDYATIIQIVVDHFALIIFLVVGLTMLRCDDVAELIAHRITCTSLVKFLKLKTRIGTGISVLLTVTLVCWGWAGYLPSFFDSYYLAHKEGKMMAFGVVHGITWVVILPLFFGSVFAALLAMFVVQELSYCGIFSSFSLLHGDIARDGMHAVAFSERVLNTTKEEFAKFKGAYMSAWELNKRLQRRAAIPFMVFWLVEILLAAFSIWSLMQGFDAALDDVRVSRLQDHWVLVVRLTFFMGHSLWYGAGSLIVAFLPFGTNCYSIRIRQLGRKLRFTEASMKDEFMTMLKNHDMNFRFGLLWTPLWALPIYTLLLTLNIVGFNADAARLWGAYKHE